MGKIMFVLIMEHMCVVCGIEFVLVTFFRPMLLNFTISTYQYKNIATWNSIFMVPVFDNLVYILAPKMLEIYCIKSLVFIFLIYFNPW